MLSSESTISCIAWNNYRSQESLKENFNGDHAAAFARIKAERRELMEKNAAFRASREDSR